MSPTEEIKNRLDIVDIVSESVQLRKSGRSYTGFCPFHSNTKTPAFVVFPDSQTWRCFGACADGGDIFSFVMKKHGWDFKEALEQLARRAGVTLHQETPAQKAKKAAENHLTDLLEAAADYFHQLLLYAPQAEHVRQYIQKRGINDKTLAEFNVGFAFNSWDACRNHFLGQGYTEKDLLATGLLTENRDRGTRYDRFRNRLMIPIRDLGGRTVGFGARTLDPDGVPKYLNSPQTELFDKSHLVYGLDIAKRHIREARQVVIVEGYMDVIQAWQAGFRNVVAQMGTALTDTQLKLPKRFSKRFVIALDADAAGVKATMRSLEVARTALDRESEISFDAKGLIQHEGRLQADIRIAIMPEGEDPDSIIRRNKADWPKLVAKAQPVVEYVIGVLTSELDMNDPKSKTAVAQRVIPLIKDVMNPVERDHYWQRLAHALKADERALRQLRLPQKPVYPTAENQRPTIDSTPVPEFPPVQAGSEGYNSLGNRRPLAVRKREVNFLRECLHDLSLIRQVNFLLSENDQEPLSKDDFSAVEDRSLFKYLHNFHAHTPHGSVAPNDEMWDSLDSVLQQRIQTLYSLPTSSKADRERLPDLLVLSILDWRLEKVRHLLSEVKQLVREANSEQNQGMAEIYQKQMLQLPLTMQKLHKARNAMSAVSRRRAEGKRS